VHVEFFSSPAQVFEEKGRLAEALKRDGTLVLNADDEDVLAFRPLTESPSILYGLAENADILGTSYEIEYEGEGKEKHPVGVSFVANINQESVHVTLKGSLGVQTMYPILSAFAVGSALNLSPKKMLQSLSYHSPAPGRMRVLPGIKGTTIIDDTYNSSPVALHEALNTLGHADAVHKKIAVLGDMLELGVYSAEEHKRAGKHVKEVADILITVGVRARGIAEGALDNKMSEKKVFQFESSRDAGKYLQTILKAGDVVLVKGSQGVRMEKTVEEILLNPLEKEKLLVRQDTEWANR
jgi:UDP-N-acetylmuramoyl-tripeptide--D-alanyl-D-alanine ligase